jgi:hypothetical protein
MLRFWIHLRYGNAGFVNGWVGIEDSPEERGLEMLNKIKESFAMSPAR